jgi:hypothetical protein
MKTTFEYCIPTYNGEDNWHTIEAFDAEEAAEKAGARYNEDGDYPLMDGETEFVLIRENEESPIQIFSVGAEPSIDYHSYEVENPTCNYCKSDLKQRIINGSSYTREGHTYCTHTCWRSYYDAKYKEYKKNLEKILK